MKQVTLMAACAIVLCTILTACNRDGTAGPRSGTGGKETVQFWYSNGGDSEKWELWRIDEFVKAKPQYTVESTYVPEGAGIRNGKLMAAINSGDVPDLIVTDAMNEAYALATQGAFEPLDQALKEIGFDFSKINPAVIPLMQWRGVTYFYPQNTDTLLLFYRTDIFEEAGLDPSKPPKTIAELDEYAQKLTVTSGRDVSRYGFIPWLDAGGDAPTWYRQFGSDPYDSATDTLRLANQTVARIYEWQRSYAQKYDPERMRAFTSSLGAAFSPDHAFMQGKVAMTVIGNWFCNALRIYAPDLKYNVAPIPAVDLDHYGGCTLAGNLFASPKGAKNVKGAMAFCEYSQNFRMMEDNNRLWRSLGIYKDAYKELSLYKENDPYLQVAIDVTFHKNSGQWVLTVIALKSGGYFEERENY